MRKLMIGLIFMLGSQFLIAQSGVDSTARTFPSLNSILQKDLKIEKTNIPQAYNYKHLAFFCKMEVQMEKSAKVPIKFRLGDVQHVDYLEKKIEKY